MLSTLALILLSQTQPAVRRSTPLADDPGMVTRNIPSGTQNVNVVGGGPLVPGSPDGGLIGTVIAIGPDGGAVPVQGSISATNPSVGTLGAAAPASGTQVSGPDSAGVLRAPWVLTTTPDAGDPALLVRVVGGTSGGGGGGSVTQGTVPWLVAGVDAGAVPVQGTVAVTGTVNAAQSGTWTVRNQDGVGNNLASSTSAPAGAEQALIVRNIPSGTQAVSGTVTANAGTGTFTVGQATASNLRAQTSSESATAAAVPAQASMVGGSDGTNLRALRTATDGTVRIDPTGTTTQPVSGTVTTTPPANASTNITQFGGNAVVTGTGASGVGIPRVTVSSDSTVGVTGTVTVTGSVTANAGTNLNTSALALETTLGTRLADATFTGRINTLGQKTMAASTPVVVASDQSALNVTPAPLADVTGAGTLNALNAVCSITLTGRRGASFFVAAGTLAATTVGEVSPDGTNWFPTLFVNQSTFVVLGSSVTTNPNPAAMFTPYLPAGTVAARLRVASFGSGSAACTSRASDNVPNLITPTTQVDSVVSSTGLVNVVGALDNTTDFPVSLRGSTTPADNSAFGIAVRPVLKSAASVAAKNVSCGTSATSLTSSPLSNRQSVTFFNNGTNTIFIGPTGVTTAAGLPLLPGAYFQDDINSPQEYFCVVAAGTEPMRVLEN